jgi:serine/threonine-protein phosphatase 2A activator
LSFLAFVAGIWKLGGFPNSSDGVQERGLVLGVIEPYVSFAVQIFLPLIKSMLTLIRYLQLVRLLIRTYTLEPAGSHGVWGLDDHSFLPYIFGSAQLSAPLTASDQVPQEGSAPGAPRPGDIANMKVVSELRSRNMYFSAIGFIYDVKKGPFWEHSPILYDISGVTAGWAKINKVSLTPSPIALEHFRTDDLQGMLKMYNAEVLSKFPVVQHFPFGSIFRWEKDPEAPTTETTVHTSNQPRSDQRSPPQTTFAQPPLPSAGAVGVTRAPWATATRRPGT